MNKAEAIQSVNRLASEGVPFLLINDFSCENNHVIPLDQIDSSKVLYDINGKTNWTGAVQTQQIQLKKDPIAFESYQKRFDKVHEELAFGNTYLLNLTCETPIQTDASLKDIFENSRAKYKLWFQDQFVVFSPEIFVQIEDGQISSFPMKGTIDATIENAEETILSSKKEMAEHATIVDLIRNDMSIHAKDVTVEKFRYIDEIKTSEKHLLQVSSKITGQLQDDYLNRLGDIVFSLLPGGSISGAPKKKTLEIISDTENYNRGFYTGIVGHFDGKRFDSGVMIRFIEKKPSGQLTYKSGGGIHFLSDCRSEYQEMIDKVYVPL